MADELTPEQFQAVKEAAQAANPEMADKLQRQRNRGVITFEEHVVKLAEVAGWF